jgi:hypothetical protein
MKKLLLMLLLCLPVASLAGEDFDPGYALGFKEGYLKIVGQLSTAPICPIPPIPGIGQNTFFEVGPAKIVNLRVDCSD